MMRRILGLSLLITLGVGCGEEEPCPEPQEEEESEDTGAPIAYEGDEAGECSDGADNDLDGLYDCDDPDCEPAPDCQDAGGPNQAPSSPQVEITPADATSADDLTCAITVDSMDPDDDLITYLYSWEVDGEASGITSATVLAQFTEGEQMWSCVAMGSDGELQSSPAVAEIILPRDNTPPTAPEIEITPEDPVPLDDLVCSVVTESSDNEGDPVTYSWTWQVDGTDAGITEDTVGGDVTEAGEIWTCEVTPNDGFEDGDPASVSVELPTCYGSALEFNGVSNSVSVAASEDFAWGAALAVEAWVRWDGESGNDDQVVVDHGPENDYSFTLSVAGQTTSDHSLCGDVTAGSVLFMAAGYSGEAKTCLESATQLTAGDWAHIAVTYDAQDMYIFINGVESVYGRTGTELHDASDYDLYVGGWADSEASFYGIIDEVRISSTARYTADFTVEQAPEVDADTVLLLHMDEGYGTTLTDDTGNGHDGTIESATWSAYSSCDAIGAR